MTQEFATERRATVLVGDVLDRLADVADRSVQCCITSPPYWGLRDYGTGEWIGGDPDCSHRRDSKYSEMTSTGHKNLALGGVGDGIFKTLCKQCGARRVDSQLGLEETPDEYVDSMVRVFREVRRVLADDGVLWLNLGDSYSGSGKGPAGNLGATHNERHMEHAHSAIVPDGLKPKDLVGIPWRVAFGLQKDGWYLRQDVIWHKPNPMPESVLDRCTKAHEYVFMLTKSARYFFDNDAIRETSVSTVNEDGEKDTRNKRSVWTIAIKAFKGSHFAVMPEALVEPCLLSSSRKGDLVLDPFTGSGTVGVVGLRHGRSFVGTELNPAYAIIARDRISEDNPLFNVVVIDEKETL
jgi:DNA modification methylase